MRPIAKPIWQPLGRPLTRNGVSAGSGVSYDSDAQDYFNRAEALGGSFDLSSINGTYTEDYIKAAINTFVVGLKSDSLWTKLLEIYLTSCVTFDGVLAKLKYQSNAVCLNTNFVSGHYLAAGAAAGLTDGTGRLLDTQLNPTSWSEGTLGFYVTRNDVVNGNTRYIGAYTGAASRFDCRYSNLTDGMDFRSPRHSIKSGVSTAGCFTFAAKSGDARVTHNAISVGTSVSVGSMVFPNKSLYLLHENGLSGDPDASQSMQFFSDQWLTLSEQQAFSSRANALMTAIGANEY